MYPNVENMIVVPIRERIEAILSIQVCLISRMSFAYKESDRKKGFLANPKHQYRVFQGGEQDCSANNRKNGDYYKRPSLSHFTDKLPL